MSIKNLPFSSSVVETRPAAVRTSWGTAIGLTRRTAIIKATQNSTHMYSLFSLRNTAHANSIAVPKTSYFACWFIYWTGTWTTICSIILIIVCTVITCSLGASYDWSPIKHWIELNISLIRFIIYCTTDVLLSIIMSWDEYLSKMNRKSSSTSFTISHYFMANILLSILLLTEITLGRMCEYSATLKSWSL